MLCGRLKRGELCVKSGLKQEKSSVRTLFDLNFTLKDMLCGRLKRGELCVKSGLKQEKSSVRPFKLHSSFYTSRGGGDRRPQSAVWRVGVSWQIVTEPL
jgi:hypothetical protein